MYTKQNNHYYKQKHRAKQSIDCLKQMNNKQQNVTNEDTANGIAYYDV